MLIITQHILVPLSLLIPMMSSCVNSHGEGVVLMNLDSSEVIQESRPMGETENESAVIDEKALPADIDQLLDELEVGSKDLKGFQAKISYQKYDDLTLDTQLRSGNILYRVDPESGNKSFSIIFDRFVQNQRSDNHVKQYVFDGRWLAEIDEERKQYIKRELVAPGQVFDPLKLGEGPIPLPIGQTKAEVLKRFNVEAIDIPDQKDKMLSRLKADQVDGLRLIPRQGTSESKEFIHIDLFYDKQTRLPVGIEALEINGDRKTVWLRELIKNPEFTPQMEARLFLTDPDKNEWKVDIQAWRGAN